MQNKRRESLDRVFELLISQVFSGYNEITRRFDRSFIYNDHSLCDKNLYSPQSQKCDLLKHLLLNIYLRDTTIIVRNDCVKPLLLQLVLRNLLSL